MRSYARERMCACGIQRLKACRGCNVAKILGTTILRRALQRHHHQRHHASQLLLIRSTFIHSTYSHRRIVQRCCFQGRLSAMFQLECVDLLKYHPLTAVTKFWEGATFLGLRPEKGTLFMACCRQHHADQSRCFMSLRSPPCLRAGMIQPSWLGTFATRLSAPMTPRPRPLL
jgi:hypothetical protein